ncbi:MAG: phosphatase domain-containing protein [Trueperaceae bacterium]|nr:phosphatase domain-containing protein [Trueperaceae bacterium]
MARLRRRRGDGIVQPYLGYGCGRSVRVRARVLRETALRPSLPGDGWSTNVVAALRRFASAEIAGADVAIEVVAAAADGRRLAAEVVARADREGHLDVIVELPAQAAAGWATVRYRLLDPAPRTPRPTTFDGLALIPSDDAPFGVISDLDDTVLVSDATRLVRLVQRTLLQNVHHRLPFPGVAALYRAFAETGAPLFYVSSSPWNLYLPLSRFLELNGVPAGPLMLRDWGLELDASAGRGHAGHKLGEIEAILDACPRLRFLLIGDSGQEDPEIYARLVATRPGRVAGVLIRHVAGPERAAEVDELARGVASAGVPFERVDDSAQAARIAAEAGWIDPRARASVEAASRSGASS